MLSTTPARYIASWSSSTSGSVAGSVVEGVLPVDVAGSREVELFGIHEVQSPVWARNL